MNATQPKILIVDDRPANRLVLRRLLARENAELIEAGSGNEALGLCLMEDLALLLLDVQMPEMDGYEVARILRSDEQTRAIPIIFVTAAFSDDLHRDMGYDVGAADYIQKPINEVILLAKVRVFLELYQRRKESEEQTRRLQEKAALLQQEIEERQGIQEALVKARQEAEEASLSKGRFLAVMSHEIRTPMNGILGMAQLLEKSALDDKQRQYVTLIQQSGRLLLTLMNDVIDIAKLEENRITLEQIPFSLQEAVQEAVSLFSRSSEELPGDVRFATALAADVPEQVVGDPTRLRQVLFNLVSNAAKFTPKGEITVFVELLEQTPESLLVRHGVRDTGIGIASEALDKLFQPFSQADNSTTRRFGGSGLGLAICQKFIHLMGGAITVESVEGEGSTFRFDVRYPRVRPVAVPPPVQDLCDLTVLVLEPDPMQRLFLGQLLKSVGVAQPHLLETPAQLLERIAQEPAHLLLLDGLISQEQGLAVLETCDRVHRPPAVIVCVEGGEASGVPSWWRDRVQKTLSKSASREELHLLLGAAFPGPVSGSGAVGADRGKMEG